MQKLTEDGCALGLAPRCKHVVRQIEFIVFPLLYCPRKTLSSPRVLYDVGVGPGAWIDEFSAVIDGAMRVAQRFKIAVRSPAITDNRSAGFDPVTYDGRQCVSGSVRHGNKECFDGLLFYTAKHPLILNRVSPMKLAPTELVNFDSLLGPPILTEQPFKNSCMVSLQNMPQ
jgi:hypothetical protein